MNTVLESYLATWNAGDDATRSQLLGEHWAETASYIDPLAEAVGRDAVGATIAAVRGQFPGFVFSLVGEPDAHHRQVRFQWGLGPANAEPVVIGFDVVTTDDAGRIDQVLGFLDRVPG
ncbi:nuclear transport factor 2 family protein [Agromyces salentinus]|uniref:Nuclear transport factor 2 family protein n=1 Tax=Agromyces salentinus TaxID=269421 RepID=A0ABN2ME20_9MICO|nr:nuclear transport factor 2 family protein [Agromyces salentinus]